MEEPIRVLHILQRMEAGGTQALLMNIYRNIDRSKVQFDFLVEYPDKQFYDEEILKLGGKVYYSNVRNDFNIFKFEKKLKKIIKENNYKIVHVHAYTIGYFCLKVAKECGVPVRIAHSHSNEATRDFKYLPKLFLQRIYTVYATNLMACSEDAGKYLFKNKKFEVMNNAIDSRKFIYNKEIREKIRKKLNIENSFVVGHIGRFKPEKNHKFLIEIFSEVKRKKNNAKLLLIGTGDLENSIKKQVQELNLQNDVIFLGNRTDVNNLYQAMDIFIFPSLYEGLGIVAIEAQASGTPIVCSNKLPPEIEISSICKKLSLSETAEVWADEAIKLAEDNKSKRNLQQEVINAGFDLSDIVNKLQDFYIKAYTKDMRSKNEK